MVEWEEKSFEGTTVAQDFPVVISLPGPRIIAGAPFSVFVALGATWRRERGITPDVLLAAGRRARVALVDLDDGVGANPPAGPPLVSRCEKCANQKEIVTLATSSTAAFGPFVDTPPSHLQPCERFVFDNSRVTCTSSRLHLRSRIAIALEIPDAQFTALSEPFEAVSRPKRKKPPNASAPAAAAAATATATAAATPATTNHAEPPKGKEEKPSKRPFFTWYTVEGEAKPVRSVHFLPEDEGPAKSENFISTSLGPDQDLDLDASAETAQPLPAEQQQQQQQLQLPPLQQQSQELTAPSQEQKRVIVVTPEMPISAGVFISIRVSITTIDLEYIKNTAALVRTALRLDPHYIGHEESIEELGDGRRRVTAIAAFSDEQTSANAHSRLVAMYTEFIKRGVTQMISCRKMWT